MAVMKCVLGISITALVLLAVTTTDCAAGIITNDVNDSGETYMLQGVKVYSNDRQCILVGGLCVHSSDCTQATTNKGLCPTNVHLGVECCYELPLKPAPCAQHLGDCTDKCPTDLQRPGNDCEKDQFCCVLI